MSGQDFSYFKTISNYQLILLTAININFSILQVEVNAYTPYGFQHSLFFQWFPFISYVFEIFITFQLN